MLSVRLSVRVCVCLHVSPFAPNKLRHCIQKAQSIFEILPPFDSPVNLNFSELSYVPKFWRRRGWPNWGTDVGSYNYKKKSQYYVNKCLYLGSDAKQSYSQYCGGDSYVLCRTIRFPTVIIHYCETHDGKYLCLLSRSMYYYYYYYYWPCVACVAPRPSVCNVPTIYSKKKNHKNFQFDGYVTLNTSNWNLNLKTKVKVTWNDNVKNRFRAQSHIFEKLIYLHQIKTIMIFGPL